MARRNRSRTASDEPLGVLYVDKPAGPTSAEVCDFLRWVLRTRSVGHCGTLDPGATGLLVCCVGPATKLVPLLTEVDKTYRARFVLGTATTTADAAGDVVAQAELDDATWARAGDALAGLLGTHELAPPAFSAVRVDGERAHQRARRGESFEVPSRPMVVHEIGDIQVVRREERGEMEATMRVSKGSFIRSFAEELGRRLGVPAHLGALHRIASGDCSLANPRSLCGFEVSPMPPGPDGKPRHRIRYRAADDDRASQAAAIAEHLLDPITVLGIPRLDASGDAQGEDLARRLGHGQSVDQEHPALRKVTPHGELAVLAARGLVLCRFMVEDGHTVLRVVRTLRPLPSSGASGP